jgi:NAD+ synthase (glutamine-hydrolysing)
MHLIRVAGCALNQTPLDWDGNRDRIVAAVAAARGAGASILCLPELCITGYGCDDAFQSPGVQRMALAVLAEIAPTTGGIAVAIGLPLRFESGLYDAAAFVVDGRIAGIACKQNLAGDGIHYEPRWFRPWSRGRRGTVSVGGREVPVGDLRFDCDGVRVGFEICEDAWVADRPGAALTARGIDVILNPSASHFAFGKDEIRRRFVQDGSRAFASAYVYANLVGNEAGRAIYDGGVLVAAAGRMLAAGRRFSFADHVLTVADVDLDGLRVAQSRLAIDPVADAVEGDRVEVSFTPPPARTAAPPDGDRRDAWEHGDHVKEEEFTRAVALGLFDYARKSRSRGFVVSASGGADSSAVACLVAIAVRLASAERSAADTARRLGVAASAAELDLERRLVAATLTCVYQSTANSGEVTRSAARGLAEALGATFHEFDVEAIVRRYEAIVARAVGRPLSWDRDDVALQNIQARVRSPGVWMLANILGALLVSTSNRSEAAVGYATMDGDTSGGIAPLAGIDKAYLRRWLRWLERTGPEGTGPIPALGAVNAQAPTAELRPAAAAQTDEADLMPYDVLDAIERAAVRDKLAPVEAWRRLRREFPGHDRGRLAAWTERFFTLWSRNQWKRERYAPSFHLDDENLDPKTWCRFPILSGGYARELTELRAAVAAEA